MPYTMRKDAGHADLAVFLVKIPSMADAMRSESSNDCLSDCAMCCVVIRGIFKADQFLFENRRRVQFELCHRCNECLLGFALLKAVLEVHQFSQFLHARAALYGDLQQASRCCYRYCRITLHGN